VANLHAGFSSMGSMKIALSAKGFADRKVDLLVVAAGAQWKSELAAIDMQSHGNLLRELQQQHFVAAEGHAVLFQTQGALPSWYVLVVGVRDGLTAPSCFKVADVTIQHARDLKVTSCALVLPPDMLTPAAMELVVEGLCLSSYRFDHLKSSVEGHAAPLRECTLLGTGSNAALATAAKRGQTMARATGYARDLVNLPAAIVTPTYLGNEAKRLARAQRLQLRLLDGRAIARAGMGALLGVAQGSAQPPRFIELIYRPRRAGCARVALAGKGITFDSGGLSIKPAEAMQSQKRDMGGGAAVLAVMSVVRDLDIPVEVRAYVAATENMPGGRAIKPGDVVRAYDGKTIEVLNTDAEGRLVLADALAYAAAAMPDVLIDLATMTAAVRTALGSRYAAVMGTDPELIARLVAAGRACGEHLWELPLVPEYRADLDSLVADLKNIGDGSAGTIVGGLFLREFVGAVPWAHIDFSSTVVADKPFPAHPRGATGFGVRTLLRFLESC
jgi:leucyl aminopeptidase